MNDKTIYMIGGGNATQCENVLRHFLSRADPDMCSPKPCTIGQVYQPPVRHRKFFTFGLTYYLAKDFTTITGSDSLSWSELREKAMEYCEKVGTPYYIDKERIIIYGTIVQRLTSISNIRGTGVMVSD